MSTQGTWCQGRGALVEDWVTGWTPINDFPNDEADAAAGFGVAYPFFERVRGPFAMEMGVGMMKETVVPTGAVEGLASWFEKLGRALSIARAA